MQGEFGNRNNILVLLVVQNQRTKFFFFFGALAGSTMFQRCEKYIFFFFSRLLFFLLRFCHVIFLFFISVCSYSANFVTKFKSFKIRRHILKHFQGFRPPEIKGLMPAPQPVPFDAAGPALALHLCPAGPSPPPLHREWTCRRYTPVPVPPPPTV